MSALGRLAVGLACAAAVFLGYYQRRLAPLRQVIVSQAATLANSNLDAVRLETERSRQALAALRRANRARLAAGDGPGGQAGPLAALAQIDRVLAGSGMLLLSREDSKKQPAASAPPLPGMRDRSPPVTAPAEREAEGLPEDIGCVSYRHVALGDFSSALCALRALRSLPAPCRFGGLTLSSRESGDGRGSITLIFDAKIYLCRQ